MNRPRTTLALSICAGLGILATVSYLTSPVPAQGQGQTSGKMAAPAPGTPASAARYDADGKLMLPENYRRWVYIGSPLTPNGLNGGEAGFPEFHNVYVEPAAFDAYVRTGEFPEGTVIAKELVKVSRSDFEDGSAMEPSGRGYFQGAFNGMDVIVKDSKRYASTEGWGFFNFGHHALPYEASAPNAPREACAFCHEANAKSTDMVFQRLYPVLTASHMR